MNDIQKLYEKLRSMAEDRESKEQEAYRNWEIAKNRTMQARESVYAAEKAMADEDEARRRAADEVERRAADEAVA